MCPLLRTPCDTPIELDGVQMDDVTNGQMPSPRFTDHLRTLVMPSTTIVDPNRDNEFTARYLDYVARTLDRFEFWAVDQRGVMRTHDFRSGYVPLTLGPRNPSDQRVTVGVRADQALADCTRVLIWGVAGSGKSTLLRWLAVSAARSQSAPDTDAPDVATSPVPFLIELGRFPDGELPTVDSLVPEQLSGEMPTGWARRMFDSGRAMFLIDGLDEVGPLSQRGIEEYVFELSVAHPRARYIVTTRPAAVTEQWWVDQGFERFDLLSLSRQNIRTFVQGWAYATRMRTTNEYYGTWPCRAVSSATCQVVRCSSFTESSAST
jgi:NACHT domain